MDGLTIFSIKNIKIKLHYSWFIIAFLLLYSLSKQYFPFYYPGLSITAYWVMGAIASILLFVSVLLHELSHSIVAKQHKVGVHEIILFFFGGVSQTSKEDLSYQNEFKISIAGPLMSLLIAGVCFFISKIPQPVIMEAIVTYLLRLNLIIAIFNMLPGYPLDGGRVLRSIITFFTKDIVKSTYYASMCGKILSLVFIIIGISGIIYLDFSGIWFIFIGGFIYIASNHGYRQVLIKTALKDTKVQNVIKKDFIKINFDMTISDFLKKYKLYHEESFPIYKNGKHYGFFNISRIAKIPNTMWKKTKIGILTTKTITAEENTNIYELLLEMLTENMEEIYIMKNKQVIGYVPKYRIIRILELKLIGWKE